MKWIKNYRDTLEMLEAGKFYEIDGIYHKKAILKLTTALEIGISVLQRIIKESYIDEDYFSNLCEEALSKIEKLGEE